MSQENQKEGFSLGKAAEGYMTRIKSFFELRHMTGLLRKSTQLRESIAHQKGLLEQTDRHIASLEGFIKTHGSPTTFLTNTEHKLRESKRERQHLQKHLDRLEEQLRKLQNA